MKKAFTLIELLVAVGILAMVMSFASVIFNVSVGSHRTAIANAEIMQKLRAITDQLNADFQGLQKDAPLMVWFRQDPNDPNQRYDQIMFFADGDFQSTQLYSDGFPAPTGKPIRGNVARIYYGQAMSRDSQNNAIKRPFYLLSEERLLARRRHILTSDTTVDIWPDVNDIVGTFDLSIGAYKKNELYEHDSLSLAQWKTVNRDAYDNPILNACFDWPPLVDIGDPNTFHKLMCEGVGNFTIQWAYWEPAYNKFHWFPSNDPDGDGDPDDSHFYLVVEDGFPYETSEEPGYVDYDVFGVFFNIPDVTQMNYWGAAHLMRCNLNYKFPDGFFPEALKFTFALYDSKGVIKDGRTFTYIVYLDN